MSAKDFTFVSDSSVSIWYSQDKMLKIGIDVGSTTAKMVVTDEDGRIVHSIYERHGARIREVLADFFDGLQRKVGDEDVTVCITGSIGMGVAEKTGLPFVQEVVAAAKSVRKNYPQVATMIDIGGEDAKVVFFDAENATDLRMNGNCAGGTGAFIDQMAIILDVPVGSLGELALRAERVYPVASRCGVFCKTDIQNLIAKNVSREDIAASIFHAVTVQTVVTLAHGRQIKPPVLFCGGPLSFIPALRNSFADYLSLGPEDVVVPGNGSLLTAEGAALSAESGTAYRLSELSSMVDRMLGSARTLAAGLPPVFRDRAHYDGWKARISAGSVRKGCLRQGMNKVYLGIDSGSTTTKIVLLDCDGAMVYSCYSPNGGNPVNAVSEGLARLAEECSSKGAVLDVAGSCSTGYGEDLVKAAFGLDDGIVETMAHYRAARSMDRDVSFILDIGGQDMKAIFVNNGVIDRIEINEACSSGCGSFIETFARSLGFSASEFAEAACRSKAPCDLGTRCTVFMNSKVKQVLREGAQMEDIAAGLSYSVVRNCLYKVLKLNNPSVLGGHIVVQGGTMRNDAVVKALENLTGCKVSRCDAPELMGAYGCALYAKEKEEAGKTVHCVPVGLQDMLSKAKYTTASLNCRGCDNSCLVVRYRFGNGKDYYSGNRCERVFSNGAGAQIHGGNVYGKKLRLLFGEAMDGNRTGHGDGNNAESSDCTSGKQTGLKIGIPRCLNMYEDFPFWHTLFTSCGMDVVLSDPSSYKAYERSACMVMSDNICFPAKIVHSHIENLAAKPVDRIFMPFVVYEKPGKEQNSYNCPIVTGYSEVIRSVQQVGVPIDSPVVTFKDRELMHRQCISYLAGLGVDRKTAHKALLRSEEEQEKYAEDIARVCREQFEDARKQGRLVILLTGRPYHADPLIQHKVSDIVADMGADVITDDIVRCMDVPLDDVHFVSQWAYTNRILKAAKWAAMQGDDVQCVQLTSFGCGPDAFLTDAVRDMLLAHGKSLTLLKLDDIDNAGSIKLRIRSLVESLKLSRKKQCDATGFRTVPVFREEDRHRKILVPFFTPFISPLIPAVMELAGYDVENLPLSDAESCDWGLKYANNEVCYPATLVVGDIIKALKSGRYDTSRTAVAITQTGGQCRASNYISLIKKALVDAGYGDVPVVSVSVGSGIENEQPGFRVNWARIVIPAFYAILYSDCIAKFYYPAAVRETVPGAAARLKDRYLDLAAKVISDGKDISGRLLSLIEKAAEDFDGVCEDRETAKVGVVGEIYLKFNPFAHRNVTGWLMDRGIEIVPPVLTDFFLQYFVNRRTKKQTGLEKSRVPEFVFSGFYGFLMKKVREVDRRASGFRYYRPFGDIFEEAEYGRELVSLNAIFGEGWLLPAEIASYCRHGVRNVISLQPFGCIANHIVERGIENRIKKVYPEVNLLSVDFDSGVSDVNIINRLLLFIDNIRMPDPEHPIASGQAARECHPEMSEDTVIPSR